MEARLPLEVWTSSCYLEAPLSRGGPQYQAGSGCQNEKMVMVEEDS